jgi:hypothetical protein
VYAWTSPIWYSPSRGFARSSLSQHSALEWARARALHSASTSTTVAHRGAPRLTPAQTF